MKFYKYYRYIVKGGRGGKDMCFFIFSSVDFSKAKNNIIYRFLKLFFYFFEIFLNFTVDEVKKKLKIYYYTTQFKCLTKFFVNKNVLNII